MLDFLGRVDRLERQLDRVLQPPKDPSSNSASSDLLERFAKRYRDDYVGFTKLLKVVPRGDGLPVSFELNPIQRAYHETRTARDVVLKARRVGMTTEAIARDLWFLLTQDNPAVAIVCQSGKEHQGAIAVRRILDPFIEALQARGLPLAFKKNTTFSIELEGRAGTLDIVEAGASEKAAAKTGRAGRITRLHCTEMAFWEYGGETMAALRHCVAAPEYGTEIQIESTANGAGGEDRSNPKEATGAALFHWSVQDAKRGIGGYHLHFFAWYADPDNRKALEPGQVVEPRTEREKQLCEAGKIDAEQLNWFQAQLAEVKSQDLVDQETASDEDTCFLLTGRGFFEATALERLRTRAKAPIEKVDVRFDGARGTLKVWYPAERGKRYIVTVDTSEGTGGDAGCSGVLERGTGRHMATLWGQFKPWELARASAGLGLRYGTALIVVERNNHGHTVLRSLVAEQNYRAIFCDRDEKPGWLNADPYRTNALDVFEKAVRDDNFQTNDLDAVGEMRTFIVNDKGRAEAAKGTHDDLVLMLAIGWDVLCRRETQRNLQNLPYA